MLDVSHRIPNKSTDNTKGWCRSKPDILAKWLFRSSVPLCCEDHEGRGNCTFQYTQKESKGHQARKVGCKVHAEDYNSPDRDSDAEELSSSKLVEKRS